MAGIGVRAKLARNMTNSEERGSTSVNFFGLENRRRWMLRVPQRIQT